ncbi:MAG: HEAT repeat domain-containing protein [Fimbriimonadaceae bacterium]|nr:HEAT repeat domain-containing protein [Fimbriimonadaceae bacterium]
MLTWFCPYCWAEIGERDERCGHCGESLAEYGNLPYADKQMLALRCPTTPTRASAITNLGRMRHYAATETLSRILDEEEDVSLLAAALEALRDIGNDDARDRLLRAADRHGSPVVRRIARSLLEAT